MTLQQAYSTLNLSSDASDEEIKSAFKKLAAKLHPDVNKESNAEDEFKKINEAYQILKKRDKYSKQQVSNSDYINYWDANGFRDAFNLNELFNVYFSDINKQKHYTSSRTKSRSSYAATNESSAKPNAEVTISFAESVLGCDKKAWMKIKHKCPSCSGFIGSVVEFCYLCGGKGFSTIHTGSHRPPNTTCQMCNGSGTIKAKKYDHCKACNNTGNIEDYSDIKFTVAPGTKTGSLINSASGRVFIKVIVAPEENMTLDGCDIYSNVTISLLDALKGVTVKVKTVRGEKTLKIKSMVKHLDKIQVAGYGVPPDGNHIFVVNVEYPENVQSLIDVLEKESVNGV